jgi:uncharacterized membrane protein
MQSVTKLEFILHLREKLSGLPKDEVIERLNFYSEMIEDRVEDGLSEAEAVADIGTVDEIAAQIAEDIPLLKIAKEKIKPKRRMKTWEIVLIALGSPVWFPFAVVALAVIFALYVALWPVVASFWAVFASLAACALAALAFGIGTLALGNVPAGLAMIGASLVCAGLSVFAFFGCTAATDGTARLAKLIVCAVKRCFVRKETK